MKKAPVAAVRVTPKTVLSDIARAMELAGHRDVLSPSVPTGLKINISWGVYYPSCSTTPWQTEGVIRALLAAGHKAENLVGVHNDTVVVDSRKGEINNKIAPVCEKYGVRRTYLNDPGVKWNVFKPKRPFLVLDKIYPEGVEIPDELRGINIIHLPTVKTHVFTTTTGAMKNAFGGLLHKKRHWTHAQIHDTLVDLLAIQKEIHPGIFAVMDGSIAGDGPGPRAMRPRVANVLLASTDQVAIDSVAAKIMGFDPMSLRYIALAHEQGLGVGDPRDIEIVGDDISNINLHFRGDEETFASRGQKLIYHGPLKPLESVLLRSPIVPWSYAASRMYYDVYWYPVVGRPRVREMLETEWGELFLSYAGPHPLPDLAPRGGASGSARAYTGAAEGDDR
jgi:uncharacterized protein (DUF362 family)